MNISERAVAAHQWLRQRSAHPALTQETARDIARTVGRLASLLGVEPTYVQPRDSWNSLVHPLVPLTLVVRDPEDTESAYHFRYRDPFYDDEDFLFLAQCPFCGGRVPLAAVRSLPDLGAFLANGPAPLPPDGRLPDSYPEEFIGDSGHRQLCQYRGGEN